MNNPPAFPMPSGPEPRQNESTHFNEGMTLRDYFATKALQSLIQRYAGEEGELDSIPSSAYQFADAMLVERQKEANQ